MAWYNNIFKTKPEKRSFTFKRNYTGASTGRLFADFITSSKSADAEIKDSLRTLRDRARNLSNNDSYVSRYLKLMVSNVIGKHGVRISAKARDDNGSLDLSANKQIEDAWKKWTKVGTCTANGRMSFLDCQKLFVESLARDGEVLIRHIKTNNSPYGYQIQFIESDLLDETLNYTLKNGNKVCMGVEVDQYRKPIAYHLYKENPYGDSYDISNKHIRVPAEEITHCYMPNRAEQTRGVSHIATAMSNIKQLSGYLEAEIVAARLGASKSGFFSSADGSSYVGDDHEDTFNPVMNVEPGTFQQLPDGMTFTPYDPTHPTSAFEGFTTTVLRSIASGLNISYHALSNDLTSVNYSSIRQGALEDRSNYQLWQEFIVQHFVDVVFKRWLEMSITTKAINLPMGKFDKFADSVNYIPRSFAWIDPLKEMQANVVGLQNGIISYSDIVSSYGKDVEETFEQHAKEQELAKLYGISTAFQPFGNKAPVPAEVEGEAKNEE
jgi:lambda family phage portal protein